MKELPWLANNNKQTQLANNNNNNTYVKNHNTRQLNYKIMGLYYFVEFQFKLILNGKTQLR